MTQTFLTPSLVGSYAFAPSASDNPRAIMQKMHDSLNTSIEFNQYVSQNNGCGVTGDLFPFGDSGMAAVLGNPVWTGDALEPYPVATGPAETLVNAYQQIGSDFVRHLGGRFSFILIDAENSFCMVGVDRFSRYPIYWANTGTTIIAATSASAILAHPYFKSTISPQGLFNYVYFHMVPSPGSIYTGINKLLAGHALIVQGEEIKTFAYWQPEFHHVNDSGFQSAATSLKQVLRQSVARHLDDAVSTGAFLSGGLDSSTVVGMLSEVAEKETHAFAIGFSADGYDEMAYARITANHFGVNLHEYYVTPEDVVNALPTVAASYDEPFGNSSALPAYFCAKFAKEAGVDRLLAGDGGDELFAGNERYAKQGIFEDYQRIPAWLRQGLLEPLARTLPRNYRVIAKGNSYINQANIPLPDRLQAYNFLHRHDKAELFTDDFLSDINASLPLQYQREVYHRPKNASALNRMLCLDWQYTLADNDLRKVSHMCAMAGVEVVYPMLDDQLVEFSCAIPDAWKLRRNGLRYFYKESLRGWLPDETISKKKQGFGLPFGVWMQNHTPLRELAYDNLSDLKKRNILKPDFIDQVIRMHQDVHAAYYGELVWILTVLELWLAVRSPQHQLSADSIT
jgi:asparagine synthase (glutamine-hydrolysing)